MRDGTEEEWACRPSVVDAGRSHDLSGELELLEEGGPRTEPPLADGSLPRVLVATASDELTRYVCQGLGRVDPPVQGFEEHRADRVVGRVGELHPVLVVLDADLGDGFGLCQAVRSLHGRRPLVLMLVDGARRHDAERRVAAAGANGLLVKPFNKSRVTAEVSRLISTDPEASSEEVDVP